MIVFHFSALNFSAINSMLAVLQAAAAAESADPRQMLAIPAATFAWLLEHAQGHGDDAELAPFLAVQPSSSIVALTAHDFCWLVDLAGRSSTKPGP